MEIERSSEEVVNVYQAARYHTSYVRSSAGGTAPSSEEWRWLGWRSVQLDATSSISLGVVGRRVALRWHSSS
jgi:hypothetical protein